MIENNKPCVVKLLIIVADRSQTSKISNFLREGRVRFHFITLAEGTAGSEIMALLGLDSIDKSFICCLEIDYKMPSLLSLVSSKLQLRKPGKGIAFIMPLTGINNSVHAALTKDSERENEEGEGLENAKGASKYDLIVSVVNQGHVEELMESARAAGASGGTVLHGRKLGVDDDSKFLGIAAQREKDIVAILSTHEQKNEIMQAITQTCGLNTEARGMIFSLQVDEIEGLGNLEA
jgi:hypothetical protein